jgi:glycine hydroxymethyltransferase
MREGDMDQIAEFMEKIIIKGEDPKKVKGEVAEFRKSFTKIHYAFETNRDAYEYFKLRT